MLRPAVSTRTIIGKGCLIQTKKSGHGIRPGNKWFRDKQIQGRAKMSKGKDSTATRRKFLGGAAVAGVAAVVAPSVVKAQGPISMRWQSTWPSKDIFHEYALDFGKRINDMTGGDLKIEVLPAGAVVPAFQLLDAVSKGVLDGGHGVL